MNTVLRNSADISQGQNYRVNWGAIAAGVLVAFVTYVALLSLGSAIGFTSFDPELGDSVGQGTAIAAGIYTLIAGLLATFLGAFTVSKLGGFESRQRAALHGLCTWAALSTLTIVAVTLGVGRIAGAAFNLAGAGIKGVAGAAGSATTGATNGASFNGDSALSEIRSLLRDTGKAELNPDRLQNQAQATAKTATRAQARNGGNAGANVVSDNANQVAGAVDQDAVANVMAKRLNISKQDALSLIGQSEDQAAATWATIKAKAEATAKSAAGATTNAAASLSWLTFLTLALGSIAASLGGLLGYAGLSAFETRRNPIKIDTGKTLTT